MLNLIRRSGDLILHFFPLNTQKKQKYNFRYDKVNHSDGKNQGEMFVIFCAALVNSGFR